MAVLRHRTPDRPNRRPRALVATLAAVAFSFGALMGAGPAEGWAAGADQVEAATSSVSSTSEAPATTAGDTSAEPAPETEASKPASEMGAAEAPAEEEAAPSKEPVPTSESTTGSLPRAPAGGSESTSSKNVDTFEFATPVEPEGAMSKEADADASCTAVEGDATEVKLVQASGTFTAPQKLLWPIDVTVRSDSGGDFSARFRVESGESHTWEGQLPEGTEVWAALDISDSGTPLEK